MVSASVESRLGDWGEKGGRVLCMCFVGVRGRCQNDSTVVFDVKRSAEKLRQGREAREGWC